MIAAVTEQQRSVITFQSDLGWFAAVVNEDGVERLHFGHRTKRDVQAKLSDEGAESTQTPPIWWENAQKLLVAYANGECVDLSTIPISVREMTPFQQRVVRSLLQVGYGQTVTYADLAKRAGSSGAARAVGNQMAKNLVPLLIPCHRVIASGGKLGGFSAPQGITMKQRLLDMENEFSPSSLFSQETVAAP
jgi:methylated-DNA-[protein]-cysteine S-methyltransferase